MNLTRKDVLEILENEVQWCTNNPDTSVHPEYQKGFINGIRQAKYLVNKFESLMQIDKMLYASDNDNCSGQNGS
jgi:hypothetical protein